MKINCEKARNQSDNCFSFITTVEEKIKGNKWLIIDPDYYPNPPRNLQDNNAQARRTDDRDNVL